MGRPIRRVIAIGALFIALMIGDLPVSRAAEYGFAPVSGQMTSPFGWRVDPMNGSHRFHGGIDIAASQGMPVYAPQPGVVAFSGYYGGYGNVVVINHGNSLYTLYGHNSQLLVKAGDTVSRGQPISLVGSTGRSTGPHLHFEVHYNQQYMNPLTYLSYLQQQSGQILAQAPSYNSYQTAQAYPNIHTGATVVARPVKTASGRRYSRKAYGSKVVQLVNGTDVETVEF